MISSCHTRVLVKPFAELTNTELYEIIKARFNVFYLEQRIYYPDLDDEDYHALHFFIQNERMVVAYARIFPPLSEDRKHVWHAGRVLTTRRGKGLGKTVMQAVEEYARKQGGAILQVNAQVQASTFYLHLNFHQTTDIFLEAGIPHIGMEKRL